jgi:hypothetical protein
MLYYAIEHKLDASQQGVVRMCVFVLQTMSVEPAFGKNLNKNFENQETLPASIRLANFRGSYADFLIISIHSLITGSKGRLEAIYPALLAIINNMAAYAQHLSMSSCTKLMQLFASMSSPSFMLANDSNHMLLQSLLESINTIIEHQYSANPNLIYSVLRARKRVEALRIFTLEGGRQELENMERSRKDTTFTNPLASPTPSNASSRTASATHPQVEDETFAIGDSSDSDDEERPTPSHSTTSVNNSRTPSITSEDHVPIQLRGLSEKARGKLPAGAPTFQRQNSSTSLTSPTTLGSRTGFTANAEWLNSWLPELPLNTLLTVIKALSPKFPQSVSRERTSSSPQPASANSSRRPSMQTDTEATTTPSLTDFLTSLPSTSTLPPIAALLATPSPIRVHLFEWSPLSLGWYMSVLYSLIFTAEMHIAPASTTANTLTGTGGGAGPVGVWNGTAVKLFSVQEGGRRGVSLREPRGAVDAVGTRLVSGVRGLGLGSMGAVGGWVRAVGAGSEGDAPAGGRQGVREV